MKRRITEIVFIIFTIKLTDFQIYNLFSENEYNLTTILMEFQENAAQIECFRYFLFNKLITNAFAPNYEMLFLSEELCH